VRIPKLREWREARALTQVELAERAGLSVRSVAGYEAGASARLPTIRKLAAALDLRVEELTGPPSGLEQFLSVHAEQLENVEKTVDLLTDLVGTAEQWQEIPVEERERRMDFVRSVVGLLQESTKTATGAATEALRIERGDPPEADEEEPPTKPNTNTGEDRLSSLLAALEHTGIG
jgi:transcriptional regulator with XRE-family HTH domain